MMHPGIQPHFVVLHAFENVEFPKWAGSVQQLGVHPADRSLQHRAIVRRRKTGAEDMAIDVELIVLDPARMIDVQRRFRQPRFKDWREMQTLGDRPLEILEEVAFVAVSRSEDRHAADMHRRLGRFEIKERCVHRGQFFGRRAHELLPDASPVLYRTHCC